MNYIKQLQAEVESNQESMLAADGAINDFLVLLQNDKFSGVDLNGARKDWMSTMDIHNQLQIIRDALWS